MAQVKNPIKMFQVNHKMIHLQGDLTILQACEKIGLWIPRFCYSESLSIAGNCRMCLVEIENSPKLMPACAIKIGNEMKIHTQTNLVKQVRESILEFLLLNHPLDCPICDQGGECDLQDQAMVYGSDRGRFYEYKRSIQDKNGGPLIKTIMTRCIHCTRCIRFATEIAGVESLGTSGRGKGMQVGSYISKLFSSELSGNVIDLCPVGALTSKPYAFSFRPWELTSVASIDVLDGMGSNIKIDTKNAQTVHRILPRTNDLVNEQWITDKTRFAFDGYKYQRLTRPMVTKKEKATWKEALSIAQALFLLHAPEKINCQIGPFVDLETQMILKKLKNKWGVPEWNHGSWSFHSVDVTSEFLFKKWEAKEKPQQEEAIILLGCDPRYEASLLNLKLRQMVLEPTKNTSNSIYIIGPNLELTYPKKHIGNGVDTLMQLIQGKDNDSKKIWQVTEKKESSPSRLLVGWSLLKRPDAWQIIQGLIQKWIPVCLRPTQWKTNKFVPKSNHLWMNHKSKKTRAPKYQIDYLHPYASSAGKCLVGSGRRNWGAHSNLTRENSQKTLRYQIGVDDVEKDSETRVNPNESRIYQGHHGNEKAKEAEIILPSTASIEKTAYYVNYQGQIQQTQKAISHIDSQIREDWKIVCAIGTVTKYSGPENKRMNTKKKLSQTKYKETWTFFKIVSHFSRKQVNEKALEKLNWPLSPILFKTQSIAESWPYEKSKRLKEWKCYPTNWGTLYDNFYLSDTISKSSITMAKCSVQQKSVFGTTIAHAE